jgi:hypothetical protein
MPRFYDVFIHQMYMRTFKNARDPYLIGTINPNSLEEFGRTGHWQACHMRCSIEPRNMLFRANVKSRSRRLISAEGRTSTGWSDCNVHHSDLKSFGGVLEFRSIQAFHGLGSQIRMCYKFWKINWRMMLLFWWIFGIQLIFEESNVIKGRWQNISFQILWKELASRRLSPGIQRAFSGSS